MSSDPKPNPPGMRLVSDDFGKTLYPDPQPDSGRSETISFPDLWDGIMESGGHWRNQQVMEQLLRAIEQNTKAQLRSIEETQKLREVLALQRESKSSPAADEFDGRLVFKGKPVEDHNAHVQHFARLFQNHELIEDEGKAE
jgi:hypothetical protein